MLDPFPILKRADRSCSENHPQMKRFIVKRRHFLTSALWLGLLSGPVFASLRTLRQPGLSAHPRQKQQTTPIEGVSIPATFQIMIDGATEAGSFQALTAVLELSLAATGRLQPAFNFPLHDS